MLRWIAANVWCARGVPIRSLFRDASACLRMLVKLTPEVAALLFAHFGEHKPRVKIFLQGADKVGFLEVSQLF